MKTYETELVHGGDWAGFVMEYGYEPLDFSANVSPLGLPDGVRNAIVDALPRADRYPDPLCRELTAAIAAKEQLNPQSILCGNGAADLIFRLVLDKKPRKAVIPAPTFSEYAAALKIVGCDISYHMLAEENDFTMDGTFLEKIQPGVEMVFLCSPNNPTGLSCSADYLRAVLERCQMVGAILALDACFADFTESTLVNSQLGWLISEPNVVVFKAFTKFYAMAGVRLGYCISDNVMLLDEMRRAGAPWAVSSLAQAAGLAALRENGYEKKLRKMITVEREKLYHGLMALGFRVICGEANYLLFQSNTPLIQPLRKKGILLRSCGNYIGLDTTWYRTAVRTPLENQRLLQALREVLI